MGSWFEVYHAGESMVVEYETAGHIACVQETERNTDIQLAISFLFSLETPAHHMGPSHLR